MQKVIKRKAANVLNLAKIMSTKKPKIIIETIETTQTIKTTTVKTKTTSISSKKLATLSDSSDTSNDASSLKEIEQIGALSIAPSLLKPTSINTKFFNTIKTVTIKEKDRLTSSNIFNFQQLLRFQFPKINGLVLCPASCQDPRPLTNSIFIYLLDFNDPRGRNHWVLFTNIHKINCWSVYDSIGYNAKDYKPFTNQRLQTKDMVNCYNRFLGNLNVEMFTCSEKKITRAKVSKTEVLLLD